jgi:hypothetical protein|tara:strand:+ start:166 stop:351 length:186 start_codon:yes stop_codon:yes gene_type:complete
MATKTATTPKASALPHVNDFILQGDWLIADATRINEDGTVPKSTFVRLDSKLGALILDAQG